MKKEYINVVIEVVEFKNEDIITTSNLGNFNLPGDSEFPWDNF